MPNGEQWLVIAILVIVLVYVMVSSNIREEKLHKQNEDLVEFLGRQASELARIAYTLTAIERRIERLEDGDKRVSVNQTQIGERARAGQTSAGIGNKQDQ